MLYSWLGRLIGLLFMVKLAFAETRQLASGWNLVSVPVSQATSVGTWIATKGLSGKVTKIWTYDGGWKSWIPNQTEETSSLFSSFTVNRGYWFLMSEATSFDYQTSEATLQPLELSTTGWTMAGFGNQSPLSFATQVLAQSNIDASHEPGNIAKVWGYQAVGSAGWAYYASASDNTTATMNPGMAYWFLVQTSNGKVVSDTSRMTITPSGASGSAALVIGGATSLTPPGVSASVGTVGGFTQVGSASSTGSCTASTSGMFARAFSVDGVQLSDDTLSQVCMTSPATYQIGFSSAQKAWLNTNTDVANNLVIKVQLAGGQSVKAVVADEFKGKNINSISRTEDKTADSGSTLSAAMLSAELAKKAGVATDKFKLGEPNSGLSASLANVKTIIQKKDIELNSFSRAITAAATDPNSVIGQMASRITSFNQPGTTATTPAADSVVRLLSGAAGTGVSTATLGSALNIAAKGMELFANKAKSMDRGIVTTGANSNKLDSLGAMLMKATTSDAALINTADIVSKSLGMASITSNDKVLGSVLKSNVTSALGKLDPTMLSGTSLTATTAALDIAGVAMAIPSGLVGSLAQNADAAKQFAGMVGQSNVFIKQVEKDDKNRSGDKVLSKFSGSVSKLTGSTEVFAEMAKNAPNSTSLNQMIAVAVASSAQDSSAGADIFKTVSAVKTAVATNANLKVDFSTIAGEAAKNAADMQSMAILLAQNAGEASDAANVIKSLNAILPAGIMGGVMADSRISGEFGLGTKIFADAGPSQSFKVGGNGVATIILDGSGTFDPSDSSTLKYTWSEVNSDNTTTSAISTRQTTSIQISGLSTSSRTAKTYRLTVEDTTNKRKSEADVRYVFQTSEPPIVLVPQYLSVRANQSFFIDASNSFDPESFSTLTFSASGTDLTVENETEFASSGFLQARFTSEGRKSVVIGASKTSNGQTVSATEAITIKVEGTLPPFADAGYDLVVGSDEVAGGFVQLQSFSFSPDGNPLTYEWTPANHFRSTDATAGASSEFPIFTTTAAGTYTVTLVVTDTTTQKKASDSIRVIVRRGQPPIADAGFPQVVRGSGTQSITLDGSFSFSFTGNQPTYEWSGAEGVVGTAAEITTSINLDLYSARTKLTYQLKVTDTNGTSIDTVDVFAIPQASASAPVVIVERYPQKRDYAPGETLYLDASQSFSPTGDNLTFAWTVQGSGLTLSDATQSFVTLSIPATFTGTQIPIILEVSSGLNTKTRREAVIDVKASQLPPIAIASPQFIFLEDQGANTPNVNLNCFDSFSPTGGQNLSCSWRVSSSNVVIGSGSSNDKTIGVKAKQGLTADGNATITLTVKDNDSGLTSTDTIFVELRKQRVVGQLPIYVDAHIEQVFEDGKAFPAFNPGTNEYTFFDFGGQFTNRKQLTFFGFVDNPNFNPQSGGSAATVTAALFEYANKVKGNTISELTVETRVAPDFARILDFAVFEHEVSTSTANQLLQITVNAGSQSKVLTYAVRINSVTQGQGGALAGLLAKPEIVFMDRPLSKPAVQAGGKFSSPNIRATVDATKSFNPSGAPLDYQWRFRWLDNRPQEPGIHFEGFGSPVVSFGIPLPTTSPRSLEIQLTVRDIITGSSSTMAAVTFVDLQQSNDVPPVAAAGFIPNEMFLPAEQNEIALFLDASPSFSTAGGVTVTWTHEFGFNVFGPAGSRTSMVGTTRTTAWLGEGPHRLRLTVTDSKNRKSEEFFNVDVRKPIVAMPGLDYLVDGFADAFPRDALVDQEIFISGSFFANSTAPIDFEKMFGQVVQGGNVIWSGNASDVSTVLSLSTTGSQIVTVRAWYDLDGNSSYDLNLDKSSIREIFIPINVKKDEIPLHALLRVPERVLADGAGATIPMTFGVAVDPTLFLEPGVYVQFTYELFNNSPSANPMSEPIMGMVTSNTGQAMVEVTGVAPGEYQVFMSAFPVKETSGMIEPLVEFPEQAFAFVKVFGDEAIVRVSAFDPNGKLAAPMTMPSTTFMGAKLEVLGLTGSDPVFLGQSEFPMFDAGAMVLTAAVPSNVLTNHSEFKLVVSNGLMAGTTGYFAKELVVSLIRGLNEFVLDLSQVDELLVETNFITDLDPLNSSDNTYLIVFSQRWSNGTSYALARFEGSSLVAAEFTTTQRNASTPNLRFSIPYSKTSTDMGLRRDPNRPGEIQLVATLSARNLDGVTEVRERHINFPPSNDFLFWEPIDFTERPQNSMFRHDLLVGKRFDYFTFGSKVGSLTFSDFEMTLRYDGEFAFEEVYNYLITPAGVLETWRTDSSGGRFDERRYFAAQANPDGLFGAFVYVDSFTGLELAGVPPTPFAMRISRPIVMRMPFDVQHIVPDASGGINVRFTYPVADFMSADFRLVSATDLIGETSIPNFQPSSEVMRPGSYLVFKDLTFKDMQELLSAANPPSNADPKCMDGSCLAGIRYYLENLRMNNELMGKLHFAPNTSSSCARILTGACEEIRLESVFPLPNASGFFTFFFLPTLSVHPSPDNTNDILRLRNPLISLHYGMDMGINIAEYLPVNSKIRLSTYSNSAFVDQSGTLELEMGPRREQVMEFTAMAPEMITTEMQDMLMQRLAGAHIGDPMGGMLMPLNPSDFRLGYIHEVDLMDGIAGERSVVVLARHLPTGSVLELGNFELDGPMIEPEFYQFSLDPSPASTVPLLWPILVDSSFNSGTLTNQPMPLRIGSTVETAFIRAVMPQGDGSMNGGGNTSGPAPMPMFEAEEVYSTVLHHVPQLSIRVGDMVTTVNDTVLVRNVSARYPVIFANGRWMRDSNPSAYPGQVEITNVLVAKGIGPVMMIEHEEEAQFDMQSNTFMVRKSSDYSYVSAYSSPGTTGVTGFRPHLLMAGDFRAEDLSGRTMHALVRTPSDFWRTDISFNQDNTGSFRDYRIDSSEFNPGAIIEENGQPVFDGETMPFTWMVNNGILEITSSEGNMVQTFVLRRVLPRPFGSMFSALGHDVMPPSTQPAGPNPAGPEMAPMPPMVEEEVWEVFEDRNQASNVTHRFFNYPRVSFGAEDRRMATRRMSSGNIWSDHSGFQVRPFSGVGLNVKRFKLEGPGLPMGGLVFDGPSGYVSGGQSVPLSMTLDPQTALEQSGMECHHGFFCLSGDTIAMMPQFDIPYRAVFLTDLGDVIAAYNLVLKARPAGAAFLANDQRAGIPMETNFEDVFPRFGLSDLTSHSNPTQVFLVNVFSANANTTVTYVAPAWIGDMSDGAGSSLWYQQVDPTNMMPLPNSFPTNVFVRPNANSELVYPPLQGLNNLDTYMGNVDVYTRDRYGRSFRLILNVR